MLNVDPQELAKFSALADSWWDPDGDSRPLHDLNPCRGAYIASRATLRGARVLDVGCGGGILSEYLAAAGAEVTGVDANEDLVRVARDHASQSGLAIDYECIRVENLSTEDDALFDVITCMELLEHVPDPAKLLHDCAIRLRPEGQLFLSTLNRTPKAYAFAVLGAEYVLGLLPRGTHDYERFIKPSELARWGRAAGLETRDITGMSYNPLTRHAALSNNASINYLAHLARRA